MVKGKTLSKNQKIPEIKIIQQIIIRKMVYCIIGKELLLMEMKESTYRGIIIKHDPNLKDFYL